MGGSPVDWGVSRISRNASIATTMATTAGNQNVPICHDPNHNSP